MNNIISFIAISSVVAGCLAYLLWSFGTSPEDYDDLCLKGHKYHHMNFMTKSALSIQLDDDGKPVKCRSK
jgi:hypothetical protein